MLNRLAILATTCCLFTGFGSAGVFADAQEDVFKKELKALAGTWRPISSETDGNKAPAEKLKESSVIRDETGKVVGRRGDQVTLEGTVKKIDASKKPKTIDTEVMAGELKGKTIQGIYEI